jgi:hypothetical protein
MVRSAYLRSFTLRSCFRGDWRSACKRLVRVLINDPRALLRQTRRARTSRARQAATACYNGARDQSDASSTGLDSTTASVFAAWYHHRSNREPSRSPSNHPESTSFCVCDPRNRAPPDACDRHWLPTIEQSLIQRSPSRAPRRRSRAHRFRPGGAHRLIPQRAKC